VVRDPDRIAHHLSFQRVPIQRRVQAVHPLVSNAVSAFRIRTAVRSEPLPSATILRVGPLPRSRAQ
jgi:hypothetical protein